MIPTEMAFDPVASSVTANEIRKQVQHEVRMEVEFVLSEEGLNQFKDIAELVTKSQTQSVPFDVLLTIPRLKELGITRMDLLNALSESDLVEINGDGTGIRRRDAKPFKELDIDAGPEKKQKTDSLDTNKRTRLTDQLKVVEPKLFKITLNEPIKMKDSKFRSEIEKNLGKEVAFARLYGTEGYFAIDASDATPADKMKVAHMDITIGDAVAKIQECWDDDLDKFYKKNGQGLDNYLERHGKRRKEKEPGMKNEVDLVFYCNKYNDVAPLEYIFQGILSKNLKGDKINTVDEQMLRELLRYHESFEKLDEVDHFEVGFHPKDESMLTFFAVLKDGGKEPFSFMDCTENLLEHFIEPKRELQKV